MVNKKKFCKLQLTAFKNSLRLFKDSIKLYKLKAYPTSYFLSILAQEELGKTIYLEHILWYEFTEVTDLSTFKQLLNGMHDHKLKQIYSVRDNFFKYRKFMNKIDKGQLEIMKQNSVYVGLYKRNYLGKIINPSKIKSNKAKKQILFLKNLYIEIIKLKLAQGGYFDGEELDNYLTKRLLNQISELDSTK